MHVSRLALTAGLFSLALAIPLTAAADTYLYSFSETSSQPTVGADAFTYDSPVLIATDTVITPLTCSSTVTSKGACTTVEMDPTATASDPQLTMNFDNGSLSFSFLPASFFDVGDNSVNGGADIMDITDISTAAPTPEPSSFLLLATGLLGLCGVLRRRPIRAMMEG